MELTVSNVHLEKCSLHVSDAFALLTDGGDRVQLKFETVIVAWDSVTRRKENDGKLK